MLRVAAYTAGRFAPSARFRVRQYMHPLAASGVALTEVASRYGKYPPRRGWVRPAWALARLTEAVLRAPASRRYDLVLFQRELMSTLVSAERLYGRPRALDVDDAIWLHPRGAFALKLARLCDAVICGNTYLAEYFAASGRPVHVLPTAIDTDRFFPSPTHQDGVAIIGWSGTSGNLRFLATIEPALEAVLRRFPGAMLRVICDQAPKFSRLAAERVQFVRWRADIEVNALQDLAIGLMPLPDSDWARGKCAFKMLTYMACGVPVVVSPVGMNAEVLAKGAVGFGPRNTAEWVDALSSLLAKFESGRAIGQVARHVVEQHYSLNVLAPRLAQILMQCAGTAGDKVQ